MQIAKIFGIPIRLHWSFLLLVGIAMIAFVGNPAAQVQILLIVGMLFSIVVAHELGHALAARQYDIPTEDITLTPIGGIARLKAMPERPRDEIVVALAGPAVNFVFALLVLPAVILLYVPSDPSPWAIGNLAWDFLLINLLLGGFNLLPAFPMDGGRVLRAIFAQKVGRLEGTRKAVQIAKFFAFAFGIAGFVYNPMLIIIGVFIWFVGQQELRAVELQEYYRQLQAGNPAVPPGLAALFRMFGVMPGDLAQVMRDQQASRAAAGPDRHPFSTGDFGPFGRSPVGSESAPTPVTHSREVPPHATVTEDEYRAGPVVIRVVRATADLPNPPSPQATGPAEAPRASAHQETPDGRHFYKGQEIL